MTAFRVDLASLDSLVERMSAVESQLLDVHDDVASRMRRLQLAWAGRAAAAHDLCLPAVGERFDRGT